MLTVEFYRVSCELGSSELCSVGKCGLCVSMLSGKPDRPVRRASSTFLFSKKISIQRVDFVFLF